MARTAKVMLWLLVAGLLATFAYHKYEVCYQCGAQRHVFLTTALFPNLFVEDGRLSDTYKKAVGRECNHAVCEPVTIWVFIAHGDCIPSSPIFERRDLDGIDTLPELSWQRQALLAIGDKDNVLKWVAAMVLLDAIYFPPTTDVEWDEWWSKNKSAFSTERDGQLAAEIAKPAIERCRSTTYPLVDYDISSDLPDVGVDKGD